MSKAPIFTLKKIKHETVKHRKDFILDCIFVSVGLSTLYVAVSEIHTEGVISLHKNKHRKSVKNLKEMYDFLKDKRAFLMDQLDYKDICTIEAKIKDKVALNFINTISMTDKDVSLEYLAVSIIRLGLCRENRKTPLHDVFKPFNSLFNQAKIIREVKDTLNVGYEFERQLSQEFVNKIKF